MQTVTDLIDTARKALNVNSDAEFARQLGVSRGTIANWKSGYSLPDTVMCATLAGLTGVPLARVLGIVGEARAVSREEKAVWRKLAATAMALAIGVGLASPRDVQAAVQANVTSTDYTLCEMDDAPSFAGLPLDVVPLPFPRAPIDETARHGRSSAVADTKPHSHPWLLLPASLPAACSSMDLLPSIRKFPERLTADTCCSRTLGVL